MIFAIEEQVLTLGEGKDVIKLEFQVDRRDTAVHRLIASWPDGAAHVWVFTKNSGLLRQEDFNALSKADLKAGEMSPLKASLAAKLPSDMPQPPSDAEIEQMNADVMKAPTKAEAKKAADEADANVPKETLAADGTKVSPVHGKINTVRGELSHQA